MSARSRAIAKQKAFRASLPPIEERAAAAILSDYVEHVRTVFLEGGVERVEGVRVVVTREADAGPRNFACCFMDGSEIYLSPDLVNLPPETVSGIVAHEFGHAADFLYPARWVRTRTRDTETIVLVDQLVPERIEKAIREGKRLPKGVDPVTEDMIRDWRDRDDDHIERAADEIAGAVMGVRIGYTGVCMLQTLGDGVPRPDGLR